MVSYTVYCLKVQEPILISPYQALMKWHALKFLNTVQRQGY